ncbi:D-aminoacyl-TRNA deacylase (DTD) [Vairimorpha necatrix]|uniref:D-aminoacyl-tRNA deacylase n=1 Tax=Vairimorpha necatrix TaxID=6039 RepID=A0AAX4JDB2_9MICR
MRLVIQKVKSGEVLYKEISHCKINEGHIFYIGIENNDGLSQIEECTNWMINFITQSGQDALLLSQFTLFAKFKGVKPSYHRAKYGPEAKDIFYGLVDNIKKHTSNNIGTGIFGQCLDIIYTSDDLTTIYKDFNE